MWFAHPVDRGIVVPFAISHSNLHSFGIPLWVTCLHNYILLIHDNLSFLLVCSSVSTTLSPVFLLMEAETILNCLLICSADTYNMAVLL